MSEGPSIPLERDSRCQKHEFPLMFSKEGWCTPRFKSIPAKESTTRDVPCTVFTSWLQGTVAKPKLGRSWNENHLVYRPDAM